MKFYNFRLTLPVNYINIIDMSGWPDVRKSPLMVTLNLKEIEMGPGGRMVAPVAGW